MNIILDTDSYKASHWLQYPPNTTYTYSYLESRGGKYQNILFFGLQYLIEKLVEPVTIEMVNEAALFFKAHGEPFNIDGWNYIAKDLKGKLPIRIHAVAEGLIIPVLHPLMTVENTDPKCFWLTSWLETYLMRIWYPITVATQSWHIKQIIHRYLYATTDEADAKAQLPFKLHDFGSRGVSSFESASIGGAAHLVNFMGSDTVAGINLMNKIYNNEEMSAFSIPAAEHSTITTWGEEHEVDAFRNMLKQYAHPGALLAIVSDSYDLERAITKYWGEILYDEVINSGATVIIRPDSGDPLTVVMKALNLLSDKFGTTINSKGFRVLNNVRLIQGDGVDESSIMCILAEMMSKGFSAVNIAFGMGGALLQRLDRDTQRFAYKCSHAIVDGKSRDVFKNPKTDSLKRSKKGRMDLVYLMGKYQTVQGTGHFGSVLNLVFEDGQIMKKFNLPEIRKNASL